MKRLLSVALLLFAAHTALSGQAIPTPAATPLQPPVPAAAPSADSSKPIFTGTWKLNVTKSEFGQVPPPSSETDIFTQTGNDLKIATTSDGQRGKEVYTIPFTIGGEESLTPKDTFPSAAEFKILSTKGEWQDTTLIVDQKMTYQGSPGTVHSTFTLSPDGKTITRATHYSLDLGEFDTRTFYDKQ
ncbi:MAG TPA: hypothetical protein VK627_07850 [Edaphobacter sp.]|nr:hypothetical protein [Edaphobacter sp.]